MQAMTIALVTGATRGIGRATAIRLAADGHTVAVGFGHDEAAAEALATELGTIAVGGDLEDPAVADKIVDAVERELGPVGILVANAGVATPPRRLEEIDTAEWDRLHAVNLRAPFLLARRVLPGMIERGYGRIVFLSSVAAYTGGIIGAHYAASKAGLHGLSHSISQQAASHGVTANVIAPALIESDMLPSDPGARANLAQRLPVGRLGTAGEVADLIAAVVANGYLTNQSILLDGGWHPT
jgi:3-oxoacyl-[acyl-carrier protein] reductase